MDLLTFAYNCQLHTWTCVAQFELVFFRLPGPLTIKPKPWTAEKQCNFQRRSNHWLYDTMLKHKQRLDTAQARYKNRLDKRSRKQREIIKEGDEDFLRAKWRNEKEDRHELANVADGPFRVMKADDKSVVI